MDNEDFGVLQISFREKRDKGSLRRLMILPSTSVPQIFKAICTYQLMNTSSHSRCSPPFSPGIGKLWASILQPDFKGAGQFAVNNCIYDCTS